MLIWILTLLDLTTLFLVTMAHFGFAYYTIALFYAAGYLIIKFLIFREIMSGIDAVFAIYIILLAIFEISSFLYYLMIGWFLYKIISIMPS